MVLGGVFLWLVFHIIWLSFSFSFFPPALFSSPLSFVSFLLTYHANKGDDFCHKLTQLVNSKVSPFQSFLLACFLPLQDADDAVRGERNNKEGWRVEISRSGSRSWRTQQQRRMESGDLQERQPLFKVPPRRRLLQTPLSLAPETPRPLSTSPQTVSFGWPRQRA